MCGISSENYSTIFHLVWPLQSQPSLPMCGLYYKNGAQIGESENMYLYLKESPEPIIAKYEDISLKTNPNSVRNILVAFKNSQAKQKLQKYSLVLKWTNIRQTSGS